MMREVHTYKLFKDDASFFPETFFSHSLTLFCRIFCRGYFRSSTEYGYRYHEARIHDRSPKYESSQRFSDGTYYICRHLWKVSSTLPARETCFDTPLHPPDHRRYRLHHRWILLCPLVRRRREGDTSKDYYQVESYRYHSRALLVRPCQTCSHTLMRHYIIFLMKYSLLAIILLMTIPAFSYAV